jgi:hypothetical protein
MANVLKAGGARVVTIDPAQRSLSVQLYIAVLRSIQLCYPTTVSNDDFPMIVSTGGAYYAFVL